MVDVDVVAAVRRDSRGRYWLCRRRRESETDPFAGLWEYPGGKVKPGEQFGAALEREMDEEFGVRVRNHGVLDSIVVGGYRVTFFAAEFHAPPELRVHSEARWMTPAEACSVPQLSSGFIFAARRMRKTWRCFHCEFVTADRAEARAHFGDQGEESPLCVTWAQAVAEDRTAQLYQDEVRERWTAEDDLLKALARIEALEYQVEGVEAQIKDRFPGSRTMYDVWCRYDSMEGRALAAEERLAAAVDLAPKIASAHTEVTS